MCGEDAGQCPHCGAPVTNPACADAAEADPVTQQARTLLQRARECQRQDDVESAVRLAREALALRPACSAAHALLGSLYDQRGDDAAARYHFQLALSVTPGLEDENCVPLPLVLEAAAARPAQHGWMLPVLIGCIVFSGLAALFTLWSGDRNVERSIALTIMHPKRSTLSAPDWRRVIAPAASAAPVVDRSTASALDARSTSDDTTLVKPFPAPETPTAALGPSASATVPATPAHPTIEQADQAIFNAEYERAAAIYERIMDEQDAPSPRLNQQLAMCYQRLGNSTKAEEQLERAIDGYQALVIADPRNAATRQELLSCMETLDKLRAPSTSPDGP